MAQRVAVKPESLAVSTCCDWCSAHSRAPKNRHGSRRFPEILIEGRLVETPNPDIQKPNTKIQTPKKSQVPNPNSARDVAGLGGCDLELLWCLELGFWCFILVFGEWVLVFSTLWIPPRLPETRPSPDG